MCLVEPDSPREVVWYELPNERIETNANLIMTFVLLFYFLETFIICKLLLMVYLKSEMCFFYLFKVENKILLHNSGGFIYCNDT